MPRIRTLKPEFWDSPSTARADLAARLTFMALWNWADDSGRVVGNLKEIEAFAFPHDDIRDLPRRSSGDSAGSSGTWRNFAEVCGEVQDAYGVVFYRVKGRPYYVIPSFKDHQSRDFRPTSRYPTEDEGEIFDVVTGIAGTHGNNASHNEGADSASSASSSGDSADTRGDSAIGTGEQGNRGTGEEHTCSPATPSSERAPDRFEEFWSHYPRKVGKKAAKAKYAAACKRADPQQVIDGAERLAHDPNLPEERFIPHPTTWLERDGWEDGPLPERVTNRSAERARSGWQAMSGTSAPRNPWAIQDTEHLPELEEGEAS